MSTANLLHLGTGSLGLGLVIPAFAAQNHSRGTSKISIYLVNRENTPESLSQQRNLILKKRKYYFHRHQTGLDDIIRIKDFFFSETDQAQIFSIVEQDVPLYITTALKDYGIVSSLSFLAKLINLRNSGNFRSPLVFIACENGITSTQVENKILQFLSSENKSFKINSNIIFADCVVDRMCNNPIVKENNVQIYTEDYSSLTIDLNKIKDDFVLTQLSELPATNLVKNLEFYINRKKWLVNSTHQIIALYAHLGNHINIKNYIIFGGGSGILNDVIKEIGLVYFENEMNANIEETYDFLDLLESRLSNFPSTTSIALTRFNEQKIILFIEDFYRKVGASTLNYMSIYESEKPLFWIPYVFFRVSEMVANKKFV